MGIDGSGLDEHARVILFLQVCAGVEHAHDNGVVHRDLKPGNVLILGTEGGCAHAAVGDFGLGRLLTRDSTTLTQSDAGMGTPAYMAPEQRRHSKNADQRSDIYSLGVMLYEVLTGEIPDQAMELSRLPRQFWYIVRRACQPDPNDRYQTVGEMVDDIQTVTQSAELLTRPAELLRSETAAMIREQDFGEPRLSQLAKLLYGNLDDNSVLTEMLPKLPAPILRGLLAHHARAMGNVLRAHDQAVSGDLPFSYCDVVADFYARVFNWAAIDEVKIMVLERLPALGCNHNRWHVGKVLGMLVARLSDPALVLAVKNSLSADP